MKRSRLKTARSGALVVQIGRARGRRREREGDREGKGEAPADSDPYLVDAWAWLLVTPARKWRETVRERKSSQI